MKIKITENYWSVWFGSDRSNVSNPIWNGSVLVNTYSVRLLNGSQVIKSAAYDNQILFVPLYTLTVHKKRQINENAIIIAFIN